MQYKVGSAFVPGTFPTLWFLGYLMETYPHRKWNTKIVDNVYNSYAEALKKGLPWYGQKGQEQTIDFVVEKSAMDKSQIILILAGIKDMAEQGKIDLKWWKGAAAPKKESIVSALIPDAIEADIKKQITWIKWVGVAALLGVGLYFGAPLLKTLKRKK